MLGCRLLLIVAFVNTAVAQRPETKWEPSDDFKNGMAVGSALQATGVSALCIEVLSGADDDESKRDPIEIYIGERALAANQLMHSAWLMHRAVELPETVFPNKAPLKKRLTMISDFLFENHAILVDLKAHEAGRKEHFEELERFIKNDEARRLLREGYDRNIETIKLLAKYRSIADTNKTDEKE
jgi:hypothetical protein